MIIIISLLINSKFFILETISFAIFSQFSTEILLLIIKGKSYFIPSLSSKTPWLYIIGIQPVTKLSLILIQSISASVKVI